MFLILLLLAGRGIAQAQTVHLLCPYDDSREDGVVIARSISLNRDTILPELATAMDTNTIRVLQVAGVTREAPSRGLIEHFPLAELPPALQTLILQDCTTVLPEDLASVRVPARFPIRDAQGELLWDHQDRQRRIFDPAAFGLPVESHVLPRDSWLAWIMPRDAEAQADAPVTPILDTCNRSEDPLSQGGGWSATTVNGGTNNWDANGTQCSRNSGSSAGDMMFWATPFAANQEAYMTLAVTSGTQRVGLRIVSTGSVSWDGYTCRHVGGGTTIIVAVVTDQIETTINTNIVVTALVNGDQFHCQAAGGDLMAIVNGTVAGTRPDSTYAAGGVIAFGATNNTFRGDDLGGGSLGGFLWVQ